jgi:hypothetical protein
MARVEHVKLGPTNPARRRRLILFAVAAVLVAGLALVGAHVMGYRLNLTTAQVAAPTADASPEQVVTRYVEAYDARDWTTMARIYPSQSIDRHRTIGTMSNLRIVNSRLLTSAEVSAEYGNPAEPGRSYYEVRVVLDMDGLRGSDLAYPPGPNGWTYRLERDSTAQPRQITGHGNG